MSVHYYGWGDEGRGGCLDMVSRSQVAIIAVVMCRHECGIMELGLLKPHWTLECVLCVLTSSQLMVRKLEKIYIRK